MSGSSEYQVALLVAIGTLGMLFLAVAIILFMVFYQKKMLREQLARQQLEIQYQTRMVEAILESQESERKRVAADLHDSVGGMLSAIRLGLSTIARQLSDPTLIDPQKKMLDDTIGSVRSISRELMPSTLERFGLAQALRELCEQVQQTSLLPVHFHEKGDTTRVNASHQLMLYRIVQELTTNAVKHAQATAIQIHLNVASQLTLVVEDDGRGFDPEQVRSLENAGRGLGLFNIENRVRLLGATIVYERLPDHGSRITLAMPL